jgi:hypothetical protein
MREILWIIAVLAALKILQHVISLVAVHLFGRALGNAALARQPDTIHLVRASAWAWRDVDAASAALSDLRELGFRDAGIFGAPELAGLHVRLMVREVDHTIAAYYEHPVVGCFADVAVRYAGGGSTTITSGPPHGLAERPDHPVINMQGASLAEMADRLRAERGAEPAQAFDVEEAPRVFEAAYAESIAWRKARGVTAREVREVAKRGREAA